MANLTCLQSMKVTSNGSFQDDNPLDFTLPLAILQICLVVVLTRTLAFLLRPLHQPRVIVEVIGGILLGPSALGRNKAFLNAIFPKQSLTVLDTLANIGLLFFLFLVGLEIDLNSLRRTGKRALSIAVAGISLPFLLGIGTSVVIRNTIADVVRGPAFLVFMGVALSIAFPVLARILAKLKLLTTDIGRMAMSILLALAITLSGSRSPLVSLWVLVTVAAFVAIAVFIIRPVLARMAHTIGIHALFGAFVVGIVMPKEGPFAGVLIEKVEDLISSLFLPLYFVSSGLKTNVTTISNGKSWALLVLALTLGFLMNTKGLIELIVLNIGKDRKVLNDETFAIMVMMTLFTTFITTPIVMGIYKPARKAAPYKHRKIECDDTDSELRILAFFYGSRNIPTLINLIESSRGTRRCSVTVYAMHLMELFERPSAIFMVHKARRNGLPFWNKKKDSTIGDQIVVAFQAYQQLSRVTIRPMTAISDLHTIHEDIITSAHQKRAALILLPFHKTLLFDRSMESIGNEYQQVNQRVLHYAPCFVAILIDRGLGGSAQVSASELLYSIAVLFFRGSDDPEALAYGLHMAEHPGIVLTVLCFNNDDECIGRLRESTDGSVRFEERVGGKEEIVSAFKGVGRCNLFLVGQRAPVMALADRIECPELSPVGSFMAASNTTVASVLVIRQHEDDAVTNLLVEEVDEEALSPDTPHAGGYGHGEFNPL
ncbi:hypothetical protein KFK09_024349 [Dendrobium nobile]|uniref:Cation/H+ exchanger domain-containing protein n=1 Tax=Dendrobium nobile TaxID=94219 RepID=A0A8T3ADL3_DENNO|nr:hypothetical protein KFK09_024349 [Dendrobium nobile]